MARLAGTCSQQQIIDTCSLAIVCCFLVPRTDQRAGWLHNRSALIWFYLGRYIPYAEGSAFVHSLSSHFILIFFFFLSRYQVYNLCNAHRNETLKIRGESRTVFSSHLETLRTWKNARKVSPMFSRETNLRRFFDALFCVSLLSPTVFVCTNTFFFWIRPTPKQARRVRIFFFPPIWRKNKLLRGWVDRGRSVKSFEDPRTSLAAPRDTAGVRLVGVRELLRTAVWVERKFFLVSG